MRLSRRQALTAWAVFLTARDARAQGAGDDLLARVARARSRIQSLQGPFTQTRTIGLLASEVRSRGTLVLLRPDRLRWELQPPDEVTFWVGPEGIAYLGPHGQGRLSAQGARVAATLEDLRTLLGGELSSLQRRWSLRTLRDDPAGAELEATARAGGIVRSLRLALTADLLRPTRVLLVEGARDQTAIEFGEMKVNAPVDPALMRPPRER